MLRRQSWRKALETQNGKVITVRTNIGTVTANLVSKFKTMQGNINDKLLRTIATTELAEVKHRIHVEGKKADESQIGQYTNPYLKRRQKKPYNRSGSKKIIFSLTRNMENNFNVIATDKGYGLGWLSGSGNGVSNADKAKFLQQKKGVVYSLTQKELNLITPITKQFLLENLK